MGLSPLVSSYQSWMSGKATPMNLPREPHTFDTQAFGPMQPIVPMTIDDVEEGSERARPRRWQYPIGGNLPSYPGISKLVSFGNLRMYGDLYSVSRACIQLRKQELIGLGWDIVPSSSAHEIMRSDTAALAEWKDRRDEAVRFWQRPDPNYNNFANWFYTVLDDLFVIDAMTLYLHPTRQSGKGPFGSDLAALDVIDGSTIFPLVDIYGTTPRPPSPAYQQYLWGVPRVEMMAPIMEDDEERIKELGEPLESFRGDQLLYLPLNTRSWTPYGFPPVEQGIIPIITGLKRQQWRQDFFTEGTVPQVWMAGPPDFTASQLQQLQDTQNLLAGDIAQKWRVRLVPHGVTVQEMKPVKIADEADQTIWDEVMMVFDVKPHELGLTPGGKSQGLGGKGAAESMERAGQRQSLLPLVRWLEDSLFNYVIQHVWGQSDMRFKFTGLEVKDDQLDKAQMLDVFVRNGSMTIDEVRAEIDLEPYGFPETARPNIYMPTGVVPVEMVTAVTVAENASEDAPGGMPDTQAPPTAAGQTSKPFPAGVGQAGQSGGSDNGTPSTMPRPAAQLPKPSRQSGSTPAAGGRRTSGTGGKSAEAQALDELRTFKRWLARRDE